MKTIHFNNGAGNPLYIEPHCRYTEQKEAVYLLHSLAQRYPAVRFGIVRDAGGWLVFRVHEQHQQGRPLDGGIADAVREAVQ